MTGGAPVRVTLLTDFGTRDGYVGAMKGVVAGLAPAALLDDISHDLAQGDVRGAMWALGRYWDLHPAGTVHLVVVDPGVGTARRPMALEARGRYVVAPDNGVASRVLRAADEAWRAVEIADAGVGVERDPSATFHGRDVFAPAAGRLAAGAPLESLGAPLSDPVLLEVPKPRRERDSAVGEVVHVDRFGNLVSNLPGAWLDGVGQAEVEGTAVPVVRTYGALDPGTALALVNSDGLVEVAVRDGSAADALGVGLGASVRLAPG